jgi:hypothetical protein
LGEGIEGSIYKIRFQRTPKTILKHYLEFYLFKITSLLHTGDWVIYAWTLIFTGRVSTPESCREFQHLAFQIGIAPINTHLHCSCSFLSTREYRLSGAAICQNWRSTLSVSNGSGQSFRVRVRVQTEPLPNWRSGSSINPNCPLGYGSMVNSQPVGIGWVVSGSHSGFIYRFI